MEMMGDEEFLYDSVGMVEISVRNDCDVDVISPVDDSDRDGHTRYVDFDFVVTGA